MSVISKLTSLAAAGSGGSNEYILTQESSSGSYNYQQFRNACLVPDEGALVVGRKARSSSYSDFDHTEKYRPDLTYVGGSQYVLDGTSNTKNQSGYPKLFASTPTHDYDLLGPQTNEFKLYKVEDNSYGSGAGSVRNVAINNLYTDEYNWQYNKTLTAYNIGDTVFIARTGQYGGAIGSFKINGTSGNQSSLQSISPGHQNGRGSKGFVEVLPVDPTSTSTDHLCIHSASGHTQMYKVDSNLAVTGTGWELSSGTIVQYWATSAIDRDNNILYSFDGQNRRLFAWNYSNNTRTQYTVNFPSGSPTYSDYLVYMNGYLYMFVYGNSVGLYLIRVQTSNITGTEESYLLTNTSGYGVGNIARQDGFLVEGPNTFLGDTDLFFLGFTNYTNSSGNFMRANLACLKWDNIPQLASYNNTLNVASSSVSITSNGSVGNNTSSFGGDMYSANTIGNPYNQSANGSTSENQAGTVTVTQI